MEIIKPYLSRIQRLEIGRRKLRNHNRYIRRQIRIDTRKGFKSHGGNRWREWANRIVASFRAGEMPELEWKGRRTKGSVPHA